MLTEKIDFRLMRVSIQYKTMAEQNTSTRKLINKTGTMWTNA